MLTHFTGEEREVHHLPRSVMPGHWDWACSQLAWLGAKHTCQHPFPSSICTKGHIHGQVDVPCTTPCQEGCYWLSACVPNKIHVKALTPNVRGTISPLHMNFQVADLLRCKLVPSATGVE